MSTPPSPPPSLSPQRILATVWLAVFSSSLFFRAVDPIIPQIATDLSEPAETVALLATAFALPYALMQPALGAMGDVLGKTRTMFACLVIVTIANVRRCVCLESSDPHGLARRVWHRGWRHFPNIACARCPDRSDQGPTGRG
jgi:MFS family permease